MEVDGEMDIAFDAADLGLDDLELEAVQASPEPPTQPSTDPEAMPPPLKKARGLGTKRSQWDPVPEELLESSGEVELTLSILMGYL